MRSFAILAVAVFVAAALAGCQGTPTNKSVPTQGAMAGTDFAVPPLRIGDELSYAFGFKSGGSTFGGKTVFRVLERGPAVDGSGRTRDALHVRQAQADGRFAEDYWLDAATLRQFHLARGETYNLSSKFPTHPFDAAPVRHAMYGNGTGVLDRYLEDPMLEDFAFFGGFATGRSMPTQGPFNVTGDLYRRNTTDLLVAQNWTGTVSRPAKADATWGEERQLVVKVDYASPIGKETINWDGHFSSQVPLAVDATRDIKATFGKTTFDVRFNITLLSYNPGSGDGFSRVDPAPGLPARVGERATWTSQPPEGTGAKLPFTLTEALTALATDQTASTYFGAHKDAYLYYAHMYETNTCAAYPSNPPPGCDWLTWFGIYQSATDSMQLWWQAEKYGDPGGGGQTVVTPISRDYPFEFLAGDFTQGQVDFPPPMTVTTQKASGPVPPRSAYGPDSFTFAAAVGFWQETATGTAKGQTPNLAAVYLDGSCYAYYVGHEDWVFPQPVSLAWGLYTDGGVLQLPRHDAYIGSDGHVTESNNYEVVVKQT